MKRELFLPPYVEHQDFISMSETVQWGITKLGVDKLWERGITGDGVIVWIFDTGIHEHVDLEIYHSFNPTGETLIKHSHGTHVAGIVAAKDNGIGTKGLAYHALLGSSKLLKNSGSGGFEYHRDSLKLLREFIKNDKGKHRHVVNQSFGGIVGAIEGVVKECDDLMKELGEEGVVFNSAAGNSGQSEVSNISFPASSKHSMAHGAVDSDLKPGPYSSSGNVDFMWPGSHIISTIIDGYASWSGTSMACPFGSGVCALILSKNRTLSPKELFEGIRETATDIHKSGFDINTGYGIGRPVAAFDYLVKTPKTDQQCKVELENALKRIDVQNTALKEYEILLEKYKIAIEKLCQI